MNPLPQGDDTAMTDIERLQRLCLDDVPHLSHPWRRSEWTYATNGRSVIAVKRHFNEVPDEPPEPQHDTIGRVLVDCEAHLAKPTSVTVSRETLYTWANTSAVCTCVECKDCGGGGVVECEYCASENTCDHCDGRGVMHMDPCEIHDASRRYIAWDRCVFSPSVVNTALAIFQGDTITIARGGKDWVGPRIIMASGNWIGMTLGLKSNLDDDVIAQRLETLLEQP
jgi:hypothetical protein